MAQLIHSANLSKFKEKFPNWNPNSIPSTYTEGYHGIAITDDGYLISHGKVWNMLDNSQFIDSNNNKLIYVTSSGTSLIDAPTADKQVLKWDATNSKFIWTIDNDFDTRYKITINGTTTTTTQNTENDWGSIYAPTTSGTGIPSLSGNTWSWNTIVETIGENTSGIPTVDAVKTYVTAGIGSLESALTGAFQYIGDVETDPTDTNWTEPTDSEGNEVYKVGNVVTKGNKEYLKTSSGWREFGDEGSYALKTISITGTGALTGGGTLVADRTIDMAKITVSNTPGTNNIVNGVTTDEYGRVTAVSYATAALTDTDARYSLITSSNNTDITYSATGSGKFINLLQSVNNATATVASYLELATEGNATLKIENGKITIGSTVYKSGTGISISNTNDIINTGVTDASAIYSGSATTDYTIGTLTYNGNTVTFTGHDTNTWRPIYAWKQSELVNANDTIDEFLTNSINTKSLAFSNTFAITEKEHTIGQNKVTVAEIDLVWAEVDKDGNMTYIV